MRHWRPSYKAIYVIPEVHGNNRSLNVILDRILPLRSSIGQEDMLVFLGDYVDGFDEAADVIETLVNIKKEFGDAVIMLRGNHDDMMLKAILGSQRDYENWLQMNGLATVSSYLSKTTMSVPPESIPQNRLKDIIPKHHIDFLKSLDFLFQHEEYAFFHGGFDPTKPIRENGISNFAYDTTSSKYLNQKLKTNDVPEFQDDCIYVGCHNFGGKEPLIHPRYFMLGPVRPNKLYVFELSSMTAAAVRYNKSRIYKYRFKVAE